MIESEIAWLAGIIDSEGSIYLAKNRVRVGKYYTYKRKHYLKICTTDGI